MYNQHAKLVTFFRNDCLRIVASIDTCFDKFGWFLIRFVYKKRKPIVNFQNNCILCAFWPPFLPFLLIFSRFRKCYTFESIPKKQLKCICDRKYVCRFEYPRKHKPRSIPLHQEKRVSEWKWWNFHELVINSIIIKNRVFFLNEHIVNTDQSSHILFHNFIQQFLCNYTFPLHFRIKYSTIETMSFHVQLSQLQ